MTLADVTVDANGHKEILAAPISVYVILGNYSVALAPAVNSTLHDFMFYIP